MSKERKMGQLASEIEREGYWFEWKDDYLLVWHKRTQIALLRDSPDIENRLRDTIEKRRLELREVYEKTGWKED